MASKHMNDQYIVVGKMHPFLGVEGGKVLTKEEWLRRYYVPINFHGCLEDGLSPMQAFEKHVEEGFFAKVTLKKTKYTIYLTKQEKSSIFKSNNKQEVKK